MIISTPINPVMPKAMEYWSFQDLPSLLSQNCAAARTRIHLDAGGQLPFVTPEPVVCPCRVRGPARVSAAKFGEAGHLVMTPPCGHELELALNRSPGICAVRFDAKADEGTMRHLIATYKYSVVKRLVRVGFAAAPAGYLHPERMIREGLYAILAKRPDATGLTTRLCHLFECMAKEDPICLWVDRHVAEAAMNSAMPREPLRETQWYQRRCIFFLPPGALCGPKGEDCRTLGYIVIQPGLYELLDIVERFVVYEPRIYLWINDPIGHCSYHLDIRFSAWDNQTPMPGNEREAEFYRRALNLVLVLNALGLSPQACVDETLVKARNATKKERRKGLTLQRKLFNCPFIRFARRALSSHEPSSGRKLRPHNKPGWFQRYHTRTGTIWHYRPPQRANAHLERLG